MKNILDKDVEKVLYSERELSRMISRLGKQISEDYKDKNLLLVSILKGSVVTMADLMRAITIPCRIEFMVVSSYGSGHTSSGSVRIIKDLDCPLEDFDVLIVEDILDSGITLNYLRGLLLDRKPKSLRICTLLDKPEGRRVELKADYVGVNIPNAFIVGYGLDYAEKYRNLPYIGILRKSVYENAEKADEWAPVRNEKLKEAAEQAKAEAVEEAAKTE